MPDEEEDVATTATHRGQKEHSNVGMVPLLEKMARMARVGSFCQ
jgi:hypothetical protein